MLEKTDLTKKMSKKDAAALMPALRGELYALQKKCWESGIPSVVVFEGWDAAGKGTAINALTRQLEPRGFQLHPIQAPRTYETHMPWLWRFWLKLPNYGQMAIFDRSWYGRVLVERVEALTSESEWRTAYRDIVDFERTIADDGYVIIKFWLHISKEEQRRRFKTLEQSPLTAWHVQPEDWEHHRKYGDYLVAVEEMLERTETEWAPWTIVPATDRPFALVHIFRTLIHSLDEAYRQRSGSEPDRATSAPASPAASAGQADLLANPLG
jgi:polyphosphate kinase 2 (PPK2 family)